MELCAFISAVLKVLDYMYNIILNILGKINK